MHIDTSVIQALVFDFSRVLLFAKDPDYKDDLNPLHRKLLEQDADYPFLEYFYLNQELLDYLGELGTKRRFIFTSGIIQDAPAIQANIRGVFEAIYSAEKMGVRKTEPDAYRQLCQNIQLQPHEVLFVDDSQRNLDAAAQTGMQTFLFTGNEGLLPALEILR